MTKCERHPNAFSINRAKVESWEIPVGGTRRQREHELAVVK